MFKSCSRLTARATAAVLLLSGVTSLSALRAAAQGPERPDAELPAITPQAIGEKFAESMKTYARGYLEVEYEEDRNVNANRGGDDSKAQMIHFPGRFRYASDGNRWRGEFEGMGYSQNSADTYPRSWSGGFDGSVHFYLQRPNEKFVLGELEGNEQIPLPAFFWSAAGEGLPISLQTNAWQILAQETVGGYRCYSLVREVPSGEKKWREELTVSPRQGYLPVRYKTFYDSKISTAHELLDLAQADGGKWYPRRLKRIQLGGDLAFDGRITRFEPNREYADAYFRPEIPAGIGVIDYRAGYAYRNDPWWPEMKPMLRERFNWPAPGFSPLRGMQSSADKAMDGASAPPLAVQEWIHRGPIELAQLRGKVVLLYFADTGFSSPNPQRTSAFRSLYSLYHPHGLEIVEVNTHVADIAVANQRVAELEIPWPVAVDERSEGTPYGKTFAAYKVATYITALLIDHEGRVRLVPQGKLLEMCVDLLKAAGQENIPAAPTINFDVPENLKFELRQTWLKSVNDAPKTAKIVGSVLGDNGNGVLPDATIASVLRFELNIGSEDTGGTSGVDAPGITRAISDQDGRFELGKLTKGTYNVTFRAPGRARVRQRVVVPDNDSTMRVDADLSQADGLSGRVVDELGVPVAGATVSISKRYHNVNLKGVYSIGDSGGPVVSDANGDFAFQDMLTGAYDLEGIHEKFGTGAVEGLPAGTKEITIKLDPNRPSERDPRRGARPTSQRPRAVTE